MQSSGPVDRSRQSRWGPRRTSTHAGIRQRAKVVSRVGTWAEPELPRGASIPRSIPDDVSLLAMR
jgi:hypothetical protein